MSPKEMQLPQLEAQEVLSSIAIKKEWVIDPAFLTRIKPDILLVRLKSASILKSGMNSSGNGIPIPAM